VPPRKRWWKPAGTALGRDLLTPPVSFKPNFDPTNKELRSVGVDPAFYWASGSHLRFRKWYCWRQFPAVRGGLFK